MPAPCPLVLDDPERVGLLAAELVANRLRARPGLRLILPTGRTPAGMYAALRAHAAEGSLPTEHASVFQLDEYAGLGPGDSRSFATTLRRDLDGMRFAALNLLDGAAADPVAEARRHQALLDVAPIDLAVLGLGRDGHVAFDEPGTLPEDEARVVGLEPTTITDAAGAFGGHDQVPRRAITVGLRTLREARVILLLVTGEAKALALRALLEEPISTRHPASLLRDHPRLTIIADRAAAALLAQQRGAGSDHALVVLGHREPDSGSEHLASEASYARLHHAARIAHREPVRMVVMTGWTQTGGLSEAEQMLTAWNEPSTPALLEIAGRNTAENASRTLPLLLASGVIRRVTTVTSAWHVRAPYFFATYRQYGLEPDSDPARHHGPWLRMLAHEARELPTMPRERRVAMAAVRVPPETARAVGRRPEARAPRGRLPTQLLAGRVAIGAEIAPGWVEISESGSLVGAGHGAPPRAPDEEIAGVLAPGLCDLQVNGAAGHELTGDDAALDAVEAALIARGVTRFLATITTVPDERAANAVTRLSRRTRDPMSPVAGIHLEGPFLSPDHAGVHPVELLRVPADGIPEHYDDPAIRLVTLAPELPGALDLIEQLHARGVTVALGHTGADAATMQRATGAGARMVTHLFNAMAPLHHRAPGPAGAALVDDRLALGVIADGHHVDARILELIRRAGSDRVVLVSDASPAAGAPPGAYDFAGGRIVAGADGIVRDVQGRLAGSGSLLDDVLANWVAATGASLGEAVAAATTSPAAIAGLAQEARADLIELGDDGRVVRVMRAGAWLSRP